MATPQLFTVMTHSYSLTELQARPLSTMPVGSVFYLLGSRDASLYIKIGAPEEDSLPWLLTFDEKLTVVRLNASNQQSPVLPLPAGQLRIAISSAFKRDVNQVAGSVLVSIDGAVLVGQLHDRHGFATDHYVSASTWNAVNAPNECWKAEGAQLVWHPSDVLSAPIVLWPSATQVS